jgi:hypothetical protein
MTLVEAAEDILRKSKGVALTTREITEQAIKAGLIHPKSTQPWVQMQSAIRERNQQMIKAGKREPFVLKESKWSLI